MALSEQEGIPSLEEAHGSLNLVQLRSLCQAPDLHLEELQNLSLLRVCVCVCACSSFQSSCHSGHTPVDKNLHLNTPSHTDMICFGVPTCLLNFLLYRELSRNILLSFPRSSARERILEVPALAEFPALP